MNKACPKIIGKNLTVAYGDYVLLQHADFTVNQGDVFIIMGASGGGKSSLLRVLTGLMPPAEGEVIVDGENFSGGDAAVRDKVMRRCGILYQSGALFSSMTLGENVALPLQQYTDYSSRLIKELVDLKLALVGLGGFNDFYPSEISGGMKKRAGLARALALDPEILYFDEPSAGLDPVSSRHLDDLILDINRSLGTTLVIVSHELASIFAVGSNSIFLDSETKSIIGRGNPKELVKNPPNETVYNFLTREGKNMVRKPNKTMIGLFLLLGSAVFVFILGVYVKRVFFPDNSNVVVMYFQESIKGLNVGSSVVFQGVEIGKVSRIDLVADMENTHFQHT